MGSALKRAMNEPERVEALAERLTAIMKVLVEHRDEKDALFKEGKGIHRAPIVVNAGDVLDELKIQQAFSPEDWLRHDIEKMMRDPVEHLLKRKSRSIGKVACEIGKSVTMRAVPQGSPHFPAVHSPA
jgi:hypothetical protein